MTVPVIDVAISTRAYNYNSSCMFHTVILKYGIPLQEQIVNSSTKYVVKWNFDLETESLEIPLDCILEFDGGQISNGSIRWNFTKIFNPYKYEILRDVSESGEKIIL